MRNLLLGLFAFCAVLLPSLSHAQWFGGRDMSTFVVTCSTPPFVPTPCQTTPPPLGFFFDSFFPLFIGGVPVWGIVAIPLSRTVMFGSQIVSPGQWMKGTLLPATPVGGFFIPSFPLPTGGCAPPTSQCIPVFPSLGIVALFTGAAPGGFGW